MTYLVPYNDFRQYYFWDKTWVGYIFYRTLSGMYMAVKQVIPDKQTSQTLAKYQFLV